MNLNCIESQGKLYFTCDKNELPKGEVKLPEEASFDTYDSYTFLGWRILGWILSKWGIANEVTVSGKTHYVDKKSFDQWIDRVASLNSAEELTFNKMQEIAVQGVRVHMDLESKEKASIERAIGRIFEKKTELKVEDFKEYLKDQKDPSSHTLSQLIERRFYENFSVTDLDLHDKSIHLSDRIDATTWRLYDVKKYPGSIDRLRGYESNPQLFKGNESNANLIIKVAFLIALSDKGNLHVVEECINEMTKVLAEPDENKRIDELSKIHPHIKRAYEDFKPALECIMQKKWPPPMAPSIPEALPKQEISQNKEDEIY